MYVSTVNNATNYSLFCFSDSDSKKARKTVVYRKANRHRERGWVSDAMDTTLSDIEFTKMFRLSREAFNDLLEKISNVMPERNESQPLY